MRALTVQTFPVKDGKRISNKPEHIDEVDHDLKPDRIWLGKHLFWAIRNDREVTITPMK